MKEKEEARTAQLKVPYRVDDMYETLLDPNHRAAKELAQFVEGAAIEYANHDYPELEEQFKWDFRSWKIKRFEYGKAAELMKIQNSLALARSRVSTKGIAGSSFKLSEFLQKILKKDKKRMAPIMARSNVSSKVPDSVSYNSESDVGAATSPTEEGTRDETSR